MPDQYRRRFEEDRRDDRRGFQERAGDEIRSWLGDDDARARRGNDERQDRYPYGGERDRAWQDQGESIARGEPRPWRGEERGGWDRGSQRQSSQFGEDRQYGQGAPYTQGGQYGSSTYDRGSYGRGSERDYERRGDEHAWNRGGQSEWESGRGERWGQGHGERSGQGREWEGSGRSSFGGYGTGGSGSGRTESGSFGDTGAYGGGAGNSWGRQSFSGRGPKDYKRSDDRIREEISDRLTDDHHVDATEISVQVQGGEVTLTGTVPSRDQKRRAEDLAESISGVREVTNNLRVHRHDQSEHGLQNPLGLSASANADPTTGQTTTQAGTAVSSKSNRSTTSG